MSLAGHLSEWTASEEPSTVETASWVELRVWKTSALPCWPTVGPVIQPGGDTPPGRFPICDVAPRPPGVEPPERKKMMSQQCE